MMLDHAMWNYLVIQEGVGQPEKGVSQLTEGVTQPAKGVTQLPEGDSQSSEGASQPSEPLLLLTVLVSGDPLNEHRNEPSDSTFGDGSDLHKGRYFSSKKELMNKLIGVAFKGNFELRTIKSTRPLWVIECIDSNCN